MDQHTPTADTISTHDEIMALPANSMILIEWAPDSPHKPYRAIRSGSTSGASAGGIGILNEQTWAELSNWDAQTITVLYRAV